MPEKFEYTTIANRLTARFPVASYVGIQVNFWMVANILLVTLMELQGQIIGQIFGLPMVGRFGAMLLFAVMLGVLYGVTLGLTGYYLDRKLLRKLSLGKIILFKTLISLTLLIVISWLLRFVFFDLLISPSLGMKASALDPRSWHLLFYLLLLYYFFMTLGISFINQVNKKYGPGVLLPLLLGKYQNPREEERIFMFMDLKSSTAAAEQLGHLRYSAFIRDCFSDINDVLFPFRAQVYQYVGDEIVVMWPAGEGLSDHRCVRFYFACKRQFQNRAEHYLKNYGFLPVFKAGVHLGKVTAVEIGEVKKDIAYHGDTLNTAARIQSVCNEYGKDFLVSEYLLDRAGASPYLITENLGMILLRGKTERVGVVSVDWTDHAESV
ncbi:adenylate/guanylate cyclase domain-containing protein [Algoriphagus terrigena]|uniref:adenylate/guanylate cyclase domain-containing protein n=1 Tax=Algoriphagus terrigena TaxID=344884 RepID=UPI000417ECBD|nr:adenylate/guanylate cyclase domain-containing protein [Algoriphagus terrigena]